MNERDDGDRAYNNRRSQHPGGARPPMPSHNNDSLNNSALSGNTPRGQNYRKAFKPNLPSSS